ncbi:uncharacterized protein LOC107037055 [Diachasma alloeum]|uniref:uncharacterized protein LOC107037055 n=1 Tax=Diachasma alloeum TaxID=454923 RepID=UPI0007381E89|nr:uncharacterized protein LOC107037055 [Diachasma alloeum]
MEEENCGLCKGGEKSGSTHVHIQDLCPADRKRITRLVEKLVEATQAKDKLEMDVAEVRAENEALINRYDLFTTEREEEMKKIKSKLSEKTDQLNKFRLQTSHSLELLAEQVKAQETEYLKLTDTVNELLREKLRLQNAVAERDAKIRLLEVRINKKEEEEFKVERLVPLEEHEETRETV